MTLQAGCGIFALRIQGATAGHTVKEGCKVHPFRSTARDEPARWKRRAARLTAVWYQQRPAAKGLKSAGRLFCFARINMYVYTILIYKCVQIPLFLPCLEIL